MSEAIQKQIEEIEFEMARTQKNKATNYHLGTLKAKLAKLRSELINGPGGKSAGSKDAGRGFDVTKSGDTRVGLVGFPSVGKSTLLTTLTGTRSEAAAYEFTTLTCIPGTMKCKFSESVFDGKYWCVNWNNTEFHSHTIIFSTNIIIVTTFWEQWTIQTSHRAFSF